MGPFQVQLQTLIHGPEPPVETDLPTDALKGPASDSTLSQIHIGGGLESLQRKVFARCHKPAS